MSSDYRTYTCPLCGADDFDAFGLKLHFQNDWCEAAQTVSKENPHLSPEWTGDEEEEPA